MLRRRDVLALMLSAPLAARAESDPDAAVRAILAERIDVGRQSVGMIAVTLRVVNAQLTFERESDGHANAVVLHQNGKDLRGTRVARIGD